MYWKVKDFFPSWGTDRDPLTKIHLPNPEILVANRPPTSEDGYNIFWWYDRTNKVMYRNTKDGYVKD